MSINLKKAPEAFDGKQLITTNAFPEFCVETIVGCGDDAAQGIGAGAEFELQRSSEGEETLEFYFIDTVWMAAGSAIFKDAAIGDWCSFLLFAPATAVSSTPGAGDCNLVPTGLGFNIVVPAAGDGSHTLQTPVLVPNAGKTGYWDWDQSTTGHGTITPNVYGKGAFDMFDVELPLAKFANKVPILGTGSVHLGIHNVRSKALYPYWKCRVTLHNHDGAHTVLFAWHLVLGRARTV
jgi:hypothetical protein